MSEFVDGSPFQSALLANAIKEGSRGINVVTETASWFIGSACLIVSARER